MVALRHMVGYSVRLMDKGAKFQNLKCDQPVLKLSGIESLNVNQEDSPVCSTVDIICY